MSDDPGATPPSLLASSTSLSFFFQGFDPANMVCWRTQEKTGHSAPRNRELAFRELGNHDLQEREGEQTKKGFTPPGKCFVRPLFGGLWEKRIFFLFETQVPLHLSEEIVAGTRLPLLEGRIPPLSPCSTKEAIKEPPKPRSPWNSEAPPSR